MGERGAARLVQGILIAFFLAAMVYTAVGVMDEVPPTISLSGDVTVALGEGVPDGVIQISDNFTSNDKIIVNMDTSQVDFNSLGVYNVTVSATDLNGNTCIEVFEITVGVAPVTRAELDRRIADTVREYGMGGEREQICRQVYSFVREYLEYDGICVGEDWVCAAYYGLEMGRGDCFTSYALARGFFEYFGMDCVCVERVQGYTEDTHYWCMVDIGDGGNTRWYHLDCTRLIPDVSGMGCLMTDAQLEGYCNYRAELRGERERYFYAYDSSLYPTVEDKIITKLQYDREG